MTSDPFRADDVSFEGVLNYFQDTLKFHFDTSLATITASAEATSSMIPEFQDFEARSFD